MSTPSPLALLLDVDGPLASLETRTVPHGVLETLARLAERGVVVGLNTGRSADYVLHAMIGPLREAGLSSDAPLFVVGEKGAVWFPYADVPAALPDVTVDAPVPGWVRTDPAMTLDAGLRAEVWRLNEEGGAGLQFADRTKLCMISLEQVVGTDDDAYAAVRDEVAARVEEAVARRGLEDAVDVAPSPISIDVEHVSSGKDLGVERMLGMLGETGVAVPERWITAGDSRSDYAMADALHAAGLRVEHMDVAPEAGVPEKGYRVLTAADLAAQGVGQADDVHERAGESLLRWAERDLLG